MIEVSVSHGRTPIPKVVLFGVLTVACGALAPLVLLDASPARAVTLQANGTIDPREVMGKTGYGGLRRALMGSISDYVVRHAAAPVVVVGE